MGTWDSTPLCGRFEKAIDGFGFVELPSLDSQTSAYVFFRDYLYPFDRVKFLALRLRRTFPQLQISEQDLLRSLAYIVVRLGKQRPVVTTAWLRFALHSLPTSHRLHDDGYAGCPWCGYADVDVPHIASCEAFEFVLRSMEFGPNWSILQSCLHICTASALFWEDAICHRLGLHLPFRAHLDVRQSKVASSKVFYSICVCLYLRMHTFTASRSLLCKQQGLHDSSVSVSSTNSSTDSDSESSTSDSESSLSGTVTFESAEIEAFIRSALLTLEF